MNAKLLPGLLIIGVVAVVVISFLLGAATAAGILAFL